MKFPFQSIEFPINTEIDLVASFKFSETAVGYLLCYWSHANREALFNSHVNIFFET